MTSENSWQPAQDRVFDIGCGLSLGASFLILLLARPFSLPMRLLFIIGISALIFVIVLSIREKNENIVEKMYYQHAQAAAKIIENVLDTKQFPFKKERHNRQLHLILLGENITLTVIPHDPQGRKRSWHNAPASIVRMHPALPENETLIQSLQQKLDDAFMPRGL